MQRGYWNDFDDGWAPDSAWNSISADKYGSREDRIGPIRRWTKSIFSQLSMASAGVLGVCAWVIEYELPPGLLAFRGLSQLSILPAGIPCAPGRFMPTTTLLQEHKGLV